MGPRSSGSRQPGRISDGQRSAPEPEPEDDLRFHVWPMDPRVGTAPSAMVSGFTPGHGRLPNSPPGAVPRLPPGRCRCGVAPGGNRQSNCRFYVHGTFWRGGLLEVGASERSGDNVSIRLRGSLGGQEAGCLRSGLVEHYIDDGVSEITLDASEL